MGLAKPAWVTVPENVMMVAGGMTIVAAGLVLGKSEAVAVLGAVVAVVDHDTSAGAAAAVVGWVAGRTG